MEAVMPQYISHKKVWALKIKSVQRIGTVTTSTDENTIVEVTFEDSTFYPRRFNLRGKPTPDAGWYFVQYEGGYQSFSPAEAFEGGYRLMNSEQPEPKTTEAERLRQLFTPQQVDGQQSLHMSIVRDAGFYMAKFILDYCPPGADRAAAIRKVREAVFTANASISQKGLNL